MRLFAMARIYGIVFSLIIAVVFSGSMSSYAEGRQEPEYAKWSRLAFEEAGKYYTLLDFKYLGKRSITSAIDEQSFRFWVKKDGREFPLHVTIRYSSMSEQVLSIQMEEVKLSSGTMIMPSSEEQRSLAAIELPLAQFLQVSTLAAPARGPACMMAVEACLARKSAYTLEG